MTTQRIRIAVAGAGLIGRVHMAAARASSAVTLAAVVDPSPAAAAVAAEAGVPLYSSLEALLQHDRPDGIVLATPNQLHVAHARTCLAAGVPVLLEKPVAPTLAEGEALLQDEARSGVAVLVGHHRAHSPVMAQAAEVVRSGRLGRIVSVLGSALFYKPAHYFAEAPWRREPGAGPILINLIHEVHNLRMLCGDIVAVQALSSNAVRGFPVEDTVSIGLQFASGALGSFLLSDTAASARSWEQTSQENPAYPSYADEDCYVVSGTRGSLSIPTMRLKFYARDEDRSWWKPFETATVDLVREDPIARQMAHFAAVVRGEARPLVSLRDGLENLRVTEAVVRAAHTGTTQTLSRTLAPIPSERTP